LRESLALLAHALSWKIAAPTETAEVLVAERPIRTSHFDVQPGQTCGIHQRITAHTQDGRQLTLDLRMFLDADPAYDAVTVEGTPRIQLRIPGGVAGDQATVAALVNVIPRLLETPPGLRLLTDLPLPRLSS
jgi:4-hydroxy-tetrahydrodipicolinate reductase